MSEEKTFAYMVLSCNQDIVATGDIVDFYWGDFIECFMESEDQAEEPSGLWAFDMENEVDRIAPVQLTLGWDARPALLQIFECVGIQPEFKGGAYDEINFLVFSAPITPLPWISLSPQETPNPSDFQRFKEIIDATVEQAKAQARKLLFVGGWGFSYDIDSEHLSDAAPVLHQAGMKFLNRHA